MRRLLALALVLALPAPALAASKPTAKTLYADGPQGRYLLGGTWLFRLDPADTGVKQRLMRRTTTAGWKRVKVPNVWNVGDPSTASMLGGVGWYRRDFALPSASAALAWAVRFESVNYRARVWLNGRRVGRNTGAYVAFQLPLDRIKRRGTNRLVVRVDSRRRAWDFPPGGLNGEDVPTGGWWNYGGIQREVYLQRVDTVGFKRVSVLPSLPCRTCAASVRVRLQLRNVTASRRSVSVSGRFGSRRIRLGTRGIGAHGVTQFSKTLRIGHPRLWSPARPKLYAVHLTVTAGGRKVAGYDLHSGIRSIKVQGGRLFLNGEPLSFRGVGLHEDSPAQGFAIDDARREQLLTWTKELGATVIRTHYPMHPYTHELADRLGLLIWSEIPVYSVKNQYLKRKSVRRLAVKELRRDVEANANHPSVMLWSLGNELSSHPGPTQVDYIDRGAKAAKALDPTRPVALVAAGYPSALCQERRYRSLDVVGLNDYFGWYPGPSGQIFDRTTLPAYLDAVRACYPDKAIVITEFGAEANRDGPAEEKGTYAYQQDFVNYQLGVFGAKPWLSGAIYWALTEFWVRPGWDGGNPRPTPPLHTKGLITSDGQRKPAWTDVQRWYSQTDQLGAPAI